MLDRFTLPLIALAAIAAVLLALAWPQGYGARSIGPFGHTPVQQTPEMQAAMKREYDHAMRRQAEAAAAIAGASVPDAPPPPATPPPIGFIPGPANPPAPAAQ
jgi:hypothetical protein